MSYTNKYLKAVKIVLAHEGGYVNDPVDAGGETKYGISKRSYPKVDIKNLTIEQAQDIYYRDFWLKGRYESFVFDALAAKVFDTAVNAGQMQAMKFLQRAANKFGAGLTVDGLIGPKTIEAINKLDGQKLLDEYREQQAKFYLDLIARKPSQVKYKNGWLRRAYS